MKKKSSVYILFPIVLLVIFAAYYWNFSAGYEQKQEAKAALVRKEHDEKVAEDNRLRLKAVNDAVAAQAKRKHEREVKAAKEREETEAMQNALQARDHAMNQASQFQQKDERLARDVQNEKAGIDDIAKDKQIQVAELDFLQVETVKANANVQSLTTVLTQITAADEAYSSAAAAAAKAAADAKK